MNHAATSLDGLALSATVHCLTGCAIGEVLGLVIATALGWHDLPSVLLAIVLAFVFGYGLTIRSSGAAWPDPLPSPDSSPIPSTAG
jgi:NhaP-type Na+/H+ or K+/H+ antiporter